MARTNSKIRWQKRRIMPKKTIIIALAVLSMFVSAVLAQEKEELKFSQKQFEMLQRCSTRKDINEWNQWRIAHPDEDVLLEDAHMKESHLEGIYLNTGKFTDRTGKQREFTGSVYLKDAKFHKAYLREANFEGADLEQASLSETNLENSRFARARLFQVHLKQANLKNANLENALLGKGMLQSANLEDANLKGANLTWANLERANLSGSNLQKCELGLANLERTNLLAAKLQDAKLLNANLRYSNLQAANLKGAYLQIAHLEGANLSYAHLEDTDFREAYLEGTNFSSSFLQGANFQFSTVNGRTMFNNPNVDHFTDFRGVGLGSMRIDSKTKQTLEYNIRRLNWKDWYEGHKLMRWPVRFFWLISDYGSSTKQILFTFAVSSILFAGIYCNFGMRDLRFIVGLYERKGASSSGQSRLRIFFRALCFSVATMTTFGFGKIYANPESTKGQWLVVVQLLWGYIVMGALITRLAILFTASGPA